jgi:mRNA interferase MazF
MKRGEIWTVAGGPDYTGKPRPAVILQDDAFDSTRSVTVCLLTSHPISSIRPAVAPSVQNGLRVASRLMVDKVTTLPRTKIQTRMGRLADEDVSRMNKSVFLFLGLSASSSR